jgi:ADP-ribose pyrophosphatase
VDLREDLPAPPAVAVTEVRPRGEGGRIFLGLDRVQACCAFPNGTTSEPFLYDVVTRVAVDAVVILPTFRRNGVDFVVLRSALRVPMALRRPELGNLWELPAGLVEVGERPEEAAARELLEEVGAKLEPSALRPLGAPVTPAPAVIAEIQHFVRAEISPDEVGIPEEDGSPLERFAHVLALPLPTALDALARSGLIDAKTELGLRRLVDDLARHPNTDIHDRGKPAEGRPT